MSCSQYQYGAKTRGSSLLYRLNPFLGDVKKCKKMAAYGGKRAKRKKVKGYEPPGGMRSLAGMNIPKFTPSSNSNPLPDNPQLAQVYNPPPAKVTVNPDDLIDKTMPPPDPKITKDMVKNYKKLGLKPKKVLSPVFFDTNSGELDITQTQQFTDAEDYGLGGYHILIEGHTDNVGKPQKNMELSIKRAKDVEDLLTTIGVPTDKVSVIGYGETQPIAPNNSEANRRKNRRVQFLIF